MVPVGFTLQPEVEFLDRLDELIVARADYYEIAPETTWRTDERGRLVPNGFHRRFAALGAATGKPFVAHGVGWSLGSGAPADAGRRRAWLARLGADERQFRFQWYTDHLGATALDGLAVTLPLPLPMTRAAALVVRRRLASMQRAVADVGVENNVAYFLLGTPLEEADFLQAVTAAPRTHLLLDVHNLFTMAQNFGFDPEAYLARLDLSRVIEIHVSGGADSDPAWLPSGRVLRLDSHDAAVPEPVWTLLERVAPRCPRLRGVTLERMEGTVGDADVPLLLDEFERARRLCARLG
jgi:uncharacterized protein (UPF0276 family)